MRAVDLIQKKRDGGILSKEEIDFLLMGYHRGEIPDYQISSFLMAVFFRGMEEGELKHFTEVMRDSGEIIEIKGVERFILDKHSTGGVGDKTTISLAPMLAVFDIATAKLSGKGLGHTGGTIDKFEAIPGFTFAKRAEEMVRLINSTCIGIMGYSDSIVPLDKKLYGLRDVTATVPSIPLIASSVMSKKLAVRSDAIILDVKVGSGAFMKTLDEARKLAAEMKKIGENFGRKIKVLLTNMDEPLGLAVGNSLEVIEAVEMLKGRGPEDFRELIYTITGTALVMKGDALTLEEGIKMAEKAVADGKPLEMLKKFIKECGGDERIVDDYSLLPGALYMQEVFSKSEGYISAINAEKVGTAAMILGAGRASKEDVIDYGVGIVCTKKIGDFVKEGESLGKFYYSSEEKFREGKKIFEEAFTVVESYKEKTPIIIEII